MLSSRISFYGRLVRTGEETMQVDTDTAALFRFVFESPTDDHIRRLSRPSTSSSSATSLSATAFTSQCLQEARAMVA